MEARSRDASGEETCIHTEVETHCAEKIRVAVLAAAIAAPTVEFRCSASALCRRRAAACVHVIGATNRNNPAVLHYPALAQLNQPNAARCDDGTRYYEQRYNCKDNHFGREHPKENCPIDDRPIDLCDLDKEDGGERDAATEFLDGV